MYTKISKLDLCSLEPSFALGNALHIHRHWFCVTLLANFDSYPVKALDFINRSFGSLFWLSKVPISYKVGSLFLSFEVPISFGNSEIAIQGNCRGC